ncbi:cell envelope integrity protein CreD [Pseudoxanthomonas sacheonensis]|uniref:cell envelope integrity protein CreD n=1 Tax=Pseudoxanthomonas sacheonensis TaxID=443615 RepID=UPI0013D6C667|nr:cell envelope integrity protein CreD [Pseudoxanthomonas sacheonensis]KAF1707153.1 cell envelope integrity protein CreD [Pseudoxanthomonas sacheonensis]
MKSFKLLLRFLTVGGLVLLLLIPLLMIRGTISDREQYQQQATERVSQSMAGPQQFIGPLRVVPYKETRVADTLNAAGKPERKTEVVEGYLYQTPKTLLVQGSLKPDTRRIGIYDVRVFEWQAGVQAGFEPLELPAVEGRVYGEPTLVIGLADVRGVVGSPDFKVDGRPVAMESGTASLAGRMSGMHAGLPQAAGIALPASQVIANFRLNGTQALGISPIADSNRITIGSTWPHPLFGGSFLPNRKQIRADGFSGDWEISSLASSAQSQLGEQLSEGEGSLTRRSLRSYRGDSKELSPAAAPSPSGVDTEIDSVDISLVDPTDVYTQVDRASKYGILFVVLTFVAFGLFELIKRLPIHPLQYLLVGLALAIFFLLLLSLSEHIEFVKAYLISAVACIGLQFVYLSGVLKSWLRAGGFAVMLTTLYGVLYSLLISEDNALLMGSLLLFGILAAIMWITRKVDWYELGSSLR